MASHAVARPDHVPPSSVVDFDIYAPPGGTDDFHRAWQTVRQSATSDLVWSGHNGGHWIPLGNATIREILTDPSRFGNTASILPKTAYGELGLIPVTLDPPEHGPYRELLRTSLSPRAVRDREDAIREISVDLIEAVPLLNEGGRAGYGRFLQVTLRPRAFALNMNGDWAWNAGDDAASEAIAACEAQGLPCQLYAVDDEVVMPGFELGAPLRALGSHLVQGAVP